MLSELALARAGVKGHVTAIEPTRFMEEVLRLKFENNSRVGIVHSTIEDAIITPRTYDLVLCHQVVQYVGNVERTFAQMYRALRPGGTLGLGVWSPSTEQAASVLEEQFHRYLGPKFSHLHSFSFGGRERLREIVKGAGFEFKTLERREKPTPFASVKEFLYAHIAAAMRVEGDDVKMGIFDLSDETYMPKVDAMLENLRETLSKYRNDNGLSIPWSSDVVIARSLNGP